MNAPEQSTRPMSRGALVAVTLGALAVAILVVLGAVLPAEFDKDPLGIGRLTGISRLWSPPETAADVNGASGPLAREYETPFREDVVEIPMGDFMQGRDSSEIEWKVRMRKGATLTYSWEVAGAKKPDDVYFEQHGHTTPTAGEGMTVANYRKASALRQQGALVAPFDGIHGWYFQNNAEGPVIIRIKVAGFYELIPAGQPGNEAGIVPNVPASQARRGAQQGARVGP